MFFYLKINLIIYNNMENKNLNNIENWLDKNTYDYSIFSDLDFIESELRKKNLKVSVIIPTLEEEVQLRIF